MKQKDLELKKMGERIAKRKVSIANRRKILKRGEISIILNKEKLEDLYYEQKKSLEDIAKEYGCSRPHVSKIMKKYGLIRRTKSIARIEAMKK